MAGVNALDRLRQLHLVANQNDVSGAAAHSHEIAQTDLTRLVDKKVVEGIKLIWPRQIIGRAG